MKILITMKTNNKSSLFAVLTVRVTRHKAKQRYWWDVNYVAKLFVSTSFTLIHARSCLSKSALQVRNLYSDYFKHQL